MPGEEPSKKTNRKKFRGGEYKRKDQSQKEKQAKAEADKLAAQKKAEAEKAKKEQEQKEKEQREREKQRKEKEGRIQQLQQSIEDSHKKLEDFYKDKQEKREIRNQLLKDASARPTANMLKSLDSGIKRNTALIKKLKQGITEENVEHLCKEIPLLNLTRYVSEVVAAIVDFKPKSSVPAIVRICVLMHARYSEFTDDLIPRLQKLIELPPSFDNDQDKKMFFNRKKEILKLFTELFLVGILPNDDILFSIISDHVKNAPKGFSDDDVAIYGMILQITWARLVCNEFMGISPPAFYQILQHQQQLYEMQQEAAANNEAEAKNNQSATTSETTDASGTENTTQDNAVESDTQAAGDAVEQEVNEEQKQVEEAAKRAQEEKQKRVDELTEKVRSLDQTTPLIDESRREEYHNLAIEYFERISKHIVSLHKQLRHTERENTKIINLKGEMTEKRTDAYQKQLKSHDRLLNGLNTLAELLRQEVPQMPEEDETTRISGDIGLADLSRIQAQNEEEGIFGDEDTRSFYEDIRCLRELLPAVFFDSSAKDTATEDAAPEDQPLSTDEADETPEDIVVPDSDEKEINELSETSDSLATLTTEGDPMENPSDEPVVVDSKPEKGNAKLEEFVKELPKCVNRELIDDAAMNFCYIATKGNRKRLPRCLFNVPRQQLELLPYYSRLTATLHPVYPEISEKLIVLLQSEFGYLVNKKDQTNIETKIRNVRFIGELTKFKICKPSIALRCLQICLQNFSHHNIDMACNLLEACGRFLYRTPETHVRTSNFLDTMMRLKNAKNFDPRMETLIDNAFYYCKPPERVAFQKERTPIQLYIRHLIFHKLSKDTIKEVLRKLCRLSWKDHGNYLVKCLLNLKNISYSNIPYVANLVASFQNYNPDVGVKVVDACLYEFYDGLSKNIVTHQQHRVMNIKLLGELYAFCVIDTALIFNILYTLITSPCGENESFRIRLVCVLLSVCSPYFGSAADKRKFSRFLVYFQCYYFSLDFIPYDVEFMMADTLGSLPKQFKRLKTPEEAQKALYNVRQANELRKIVPFSLDRLQISFEGSADDIEEDVNDLESSDPAQKESSKPAERKHKKTRKPEKPEEGEEKEETNEEDEFDQLFDSIVRESLSTRKSDNIPNNGLTMAVPMNLFRSSNAISKAPKTAEQEKPTTTFRLLMKKGNKQTTYNLEIPSESPFANRKHDDEWEEEQRAIKRKVLEYEAQEAEEEILNAGGDAIPYDIGRFRDPTKMKPKNKNVYWSNQ